MAGWSVTRTTTMTASERGVFGTAHQHIADAKDALSNLKGCLYLLERRRYVPNGAEYARSMLDDLDEAVRELHDVLAAQSP